MEDITSILWSTTFQNCESLYCTHLQLKWASQVALVVKNPPASAGDIRDVSLIPGWGRSLGGRTWQPNLVFLPGESHGQRSLVGYNSWDCRVEHTEAT